MKLAFEIEIENIDYIQILKDNLFNPEFML